MIEITGYRAMRKLWHKLIMYLFGSHFRDEMTSLLHPEFGSMWMPPDGKFFVAAKTLEKDSYDRGFEDGRAWQVINGPQSEYERRVRNG